MLKLNFNNCSLKFLHKYKFCKKNVQNAIRIIFFVKQTISLISLLLFFNFFYSLYDHLKNTKRIFNIRYATIFRQSIIKVEKVSITENSVLYISQNYILLTTNKILIWALTPEEVFESSCLRSILTLKNMSVKWTRDGNIYLKKVRGERNTLREHMFVFIFHHRSRSSSFKYASQLKSAFS